MKDYYKILEISKTATLSEIKKAYHKMVLQYHPDKVRYHYPDLSSEEAENKIKEINEAYQTLSDVSKRMLYDRSLTQSIPKSSSFFSHRPHHFSTSRPSTSHYYRTSAPTGPSQLQRKHIQELIASSDIDALSEYLKKIHSTNVFTKEFFLIELLSFAAEIGNLPVMKYFIEKDKVFLYHSILSDSQTIHEVIISLLSSAAKSCNVKIMKYLLDEQKILDKLYFPITETDITRILKEIIYNHAITHKKPTKDMLITLHFLIEDKAFVITSKMLGKFIENTACYSCIEINAYLQSFLPSHEKHLILLRTLAFQGLKKASLEDLFRLYSLNIIKKGEHGDFRYDIAKALSALDVSDNDFNKMLSQNADILHEILFYYCQHTQGNALKKVRFILNKYKDVDVNIRDEHNKSPILYAISSAGYSPIVKLLIDHGADVYIKNEYGYSVYDTLKNNPEFLEQLQRRSKHDSEETHNMGCRI